MAKPLPPNVMANLRSALVGAASQYRQAKLHRGAGLVDEAQQAVLDLQRELVSSEEDDTSLASAPEAKAKLGRMLDAAEEGDAARVRLLKRFEVLSMTWHSNHHPVEEGFWEDCTLPGCVGDRELLAEVEAQDSTGRGRL